MQQIDATSRIDGTNGPSAAPVSFFDLGNHVIIHYRPNSPAVRTLFEQDIESTATAKDPSLVRRKLSFPESTV